MLKLKPKLSMNLQFRSADEAKKQYAGQMKCFDSLKGPINELAKKHDKASDQGYSFDFYMSYSGQDDTFAKQFSK